MSDNKMELIKELRQRTNSSLIDCKKALEASSYDVEAAINWLKENGIVKAAKKSGRIASEGSVITYGNQKESVIIEVNSETDFVVQNEKFVKLLNELVEVIFKNKAKTLEAALEVVIPSGLKITDALLEATSVIGEKISLRRVQFVEAKDGEVLGQYVHANKRIASIVTINGGSEEMAKNVAMHVSAMNPEFILVSDIPAQRLETLKESFQKPDNFDKKPANIQENIKSGWLNKQLSEFVLEKQPFVMDDGVSVEKYLNNANASLVSSIRFEVGEGIEKVQVDFASEVASKMAGE
ncbi:translation elongation factor Ts [Mycoplasma leonicaptivi]|uniref:translation elongation factor Ts n=1 Tax=Mycoplasma leonicaptivi TaxID=36742 RepID=UPI0004828A21|nr:translation elongation factor Ts [Mycoplasma leonicaptivi]